MITKETIKKHQAAQKEIIKLEYKIYNYFREVVKTVFRCFGAPEPISIFFTGAAEGERFDLLGLLLDDTSIEYGFRYYYYNNKKADKVRARFDIFDNNYIREIPTNFLFMSIQDVEKELKKEIKKNKDEIKKNKDEQLKLNRKYLLDKQLIINSVKKKLTKEEIKTLGLK